MLSINDALMPDGSPGSSDYNDNVVLDAGAAATEVDIPSDAYCVVITASKNVWVRLGTGAAKPGTTLLGGSGSVLVSEGSSGRRPFRIHSATKLSLYSEAQAEVSLEYFTIG